MKTTSSILTLTGALCVWSATAWAADPIDGMFNTGVDDNGVVRAHGTRETHYRIAAPTRLMGQPYVFTSVGGFPINPWLADNNLSAWIVPTADGDANGPPVDYTYRLYVDLAGYDVASVAVNGQWSTDNLGTDIVINGQGTGNPNNGQFVTWTPFALGGGFFSQGVNTLDFVMNNAPNPGDNPTGIRVELTGTADRIPPGTPASVVSGPDDTTVREGATVVLVVNAAGSYPVTYQWSKGGTAIQGETKAWLQLVDVRQSASGTYSVRVSNADGNVTRSAVLTVIPTPIEVSRVPALLVDGIVGRSYDIDATTALSAAPAWEIFTSIAPLTQTPLVIPVDPTGTGRFFRGREQ